MSGWGVIAGITGLQPRTIKIGASILVVLVLLALLYRAVASYGDAREQDGVERERAAWVKAEAELKQRVAKAEGQATAAAVIREEKHAAEVAEVREEINEAIAEGRSPLDVLFGG